MEQTISSGSPLLDNLLGGGYEKDIITTIYGPAGSGKTLLCLLVAISVAKTKRVIYFDTEGGFSVLRMSQLFKDYKKIIGNILFLKPTNFEEQKKSFEKLKNIINSDVGLIIIDSISMLYRLELKQEENIHDINRELAQQVALLTEIARKKQIPVIITNQVYSNFEDKNKVNIVGGDVLKYGSKCLIELQITPDNKRRAILKKHRSLGEREIVFQIKEEGIVETKEGKGFKIF
ncbi:MAG: DNA repair and recombination protein RadB [Candidatus Woesearchaeota archaeon]